MGINPSSPIYSLYGPDYLTSVYALVCKSIVIITPHFTWQSLLNCSLFLPLRFQVFLLWTNSCAPLGFIFILLPLLTLAWENSEKLSSSHCYSKPTAFSVSIQDRDTSLPESSNLCGISVIHLHLTGPLIFFFICHWALNTLTNALVR